MIKELEIKGYKSFDDCSFKLRKLTLLTGLNGSGKSSIIQSIRMLLNSSEESPYLEGHGDYEELKSHFSSHSEPIFMRMTTDKGELSSLKLDAGMFERTVSGNFISEYISAERFGPKSTLPICSNRKVTIGEKGEFSVDFFSKFSTCLISNSIHHKSTVSNTLEAQLKAWMSEISPNISFNFGIDRKHDTSNIEIDRHRATNTGFGISYALPIVLAALGLSICEPKNVEQPHAISWLEKLQDSNVILLVENPEAHLHPKGQTQLGQLLAILSTQNVQVIVETHSDHFIDGVRIACKEIDSLINTDVSIKYFVKEYGKPSCYKDIEIFKNGDLSDWPDGFFDQMQKNLFRLSRK